MPFSQNRKRWLLTAALALSSLVILGPVYAGAGSVVVPSIETTALMPVPASMEWGAAELVVDSSLSFYLEGGNRQRILPALMRFQALLAKQADVDLQLDHSGGRAAARMRIHVDKPGSAYPHLDTDESYRLSVGPEGIDIAAPNSYGALHALQTLRQLAGNCSGRLCFPAVEIQDQPRFAWRGILIDVVRHWMPPEVIKRQLDAMAAVKLNVLHWHLSDDQSFRIESEAYPLLQQKGSDGNYYTRQQIRDIVEYAADRGIRIMPELDLPGHSRSWQIAYPELASRPDEDYKLYATTGIFSDPINPAREEVYVFLETLVAEMADLFPDRYFHLGGDEVDYSAWEDSDQVNEFMQARGMEDYTELQAYFVQRYGRIIAAQGKIAVGWNEILHRDLADEVVLHLWDSMDFPPLVQQHPLLISTNYYLDHVLSAQFHYRNDALAVTVDGVNTPALADNILGVEAASWAEIIDPRNIDICIWPRTAAIAERLWSPAAFTDNADMDDVYRRMAVVSRRLHQMGMMHWRNQRAELVELADGGDIEALQTLADVIQPMAFYPMFSWEAFGRLFAPWYFGEMADEPIALQAFTRVLAYESLLAWQFNRDVDRYLENPDDEELARELLAQLQVWSGNYPLVAPMVHKSEILQEVGVDKLSLALGELADIGIEVIEAKRKGREFSAGELADFRDTLERFKPPPAVFTREYLWYVVWRLFEPRSHLQHTFPVQPGIAALVAAVDP